MGFGQDAIPLVPDSKKGALPEDEANNNVLGASKFLAEKTGIAAGKIDNVFRTLLFSQAYDVADRIDRKVFDRSASPNPLGPASFVPGLKIVSPDRSNVQATNKFYDDLNRVEEGQKSLQIYKARGDIDGMRKIYENYPEAVQLGPMYTQMSKWVGQQKSLQGMIEYNQNLDPSTRREMIDRIQGMINQRLDVFNQIVGSRK